MSLEQWSRNGWLRRAEATVAEIQQLLQVVDRDLADSKVPGLSVDGRFMHAYEAALQLCVIALRACGYHVEKGQGKHKHAIGSLKFTLGKTWSDTADHIEACSGLRGHAVYERTGVVSEEHAQDLISAAEQLQSDVINWLKNEHAELVPPGI